MAATPCAAQDLSRSAPANPSPVSVTASNEALGQAIFTPVPAPGADRAALHAAGGRLRLGFAPRPRSNAFGGADAGAEIRIRGDLGKRYFVYASTGDQSVAPPPATEAWRGGEPVRFNDTKAGVGWRKGGVETSLGYVHRKYRPTYNPNGLQRRGGSMVGVSLTFRPGG